MRIVVIGEGKVGFTLTRELSREGHDLLVIDNRKDALVQVEERLNRPKPPPGGTASGWT